MEDGLARTHGDARLRFIDLLSSVQPFVTIDPEVLYRVPNSLRYEHPAMIVRGDSRAQPVRLRIVPRRVNLLAEPMEGWPSG